MLQLTVSCCNWKYNSHYVGQYTCLRKSVDCYSVGVC